MTEPTSTAAAALNYVNTLGTLQDVLDMIDLLNSMELPPKVPSPPTPAAATALGAPVVTGDAATIAASQGFAGGSGAQQATSAFQSGQGGVQTVNAPHAAPGKHAPSGLTHISKHGLSSFPMYDDTRSWVDPNGYRLSDRVWKSGQDVRDNIDKAIRKATVSKHSFESLARDLEQYLHSDLKPNRRSDGWLAKHQTPGNITRNGRGRGSYPARRLARTELTRQHSRMALYSATANPYADGVRWRLSPRHTDADECNLHARTYRKTEMNWPPDIMPPLHPFCLCRLDQLYNKKPKVTNQLQQAVGGAISTVQEGVTKLQQMGFDINVATPTALSHVTPAEFNDFVEGFAAIDAAGLDKGFTIHLTDANGNGSKDIGIAYFEVGSGNSKPFMEFDMRGVKNSSTIEAVVGKDYGIPTTPQTVIWHEYGHYAHDQAMLAATGGHAFKGYQNPWLKAKETYGIPATEIAEKVSKYAAVNQSEFVAEVFTGLSLGNTYDADVLGLYHSLNGPTAFPKVASTIPAAPAKQTAATLAPLYNGLDASGMVQLDLVQDALKRLEADYKQGMGNVLIELGPYTGRRRQLRSQELALNGTLKENDFLSRLAKADQDLAAGTITAETHGFIKDEVDSGLQALQHKQIQDGWDAAVAPVLAANWTAMPATSYDLFTPFSQSLDALKLVPSGGFAIPKKYSDLIDDTYHAAQGVFDKKTTWADVTTQLKQAQADLAAGVIDTAKFASLQNANQVAANLLQLSLPAKPQFLHFAPSTMTSMGDAGTFDWALQQAAKSGSLNAGDLSDASKFAQGQIDKAHALGTIDTAMVDKLETAVDDALQKAHAAMNAHKAGTLTVTPQKAGHTPVSANVPNLDTPVEAMTKLQLNTLQAKQDLANGLITPKQKANIVYENNSKVKVLTEINLAQHTPGALDDIVANLEATWAKAQADVAAGLMTPGKLKAIKEHYDFQLPVAKEYAAAAKVVPTVTMQDFTAELADKVTGMYDDLIQKGINGATANRKEKELRARLSAGIVDPDERARTVVEYAAYQKHKSRIDFQGGYTKKPKPTFETPDDLLKLYNDATPPGAEIGWGTVQQVAPPTYYSAPPYSPAFVQAEADRLTKFFNQGSSSKSSNAQRIGKRMADDPDAVAALLEYERVTGTKVHSPYQPGANGNPSTGNPIEDRMTGYYADRQSDWAANSGDDRVKPVRMQHAIDQEFGLNTAVKPYSASTIDAALGKATGYQASSNVAAAEELALMRKVARHMYEETQDVLEKAGFNELHLHRGVQLDSKAAWTPDWARGMKKGDEVIAAFPLQPASSFASNRATSGGFAYMWSGDLNIMLRTVVDRHQVLAFSHTGFGCFNEYEFVLLGTDDAMMHAYRMKSRND